MKYKVHVRFDFEIEADLGLDAIQQIEQILFEGNVAHKAQPYLTFIECRKD